jgi:NAD(P)-dependent dehydrogenase (short-subunit alcohol dehydrogenase family)
LAVRSLADLAEQQFGRIEAWANAAAASVRPRRRDHRRRVRTVMRVNFLGQVYGVHAALPTLRREREDA